MERKGQRDSPIKILVSERSHGNQEGGHWASEGLHLLLSFLLAEISLDCSNKALAQRGKSKYPCHKFCSSGYLNSMHQNALLILFQEAF